MKSKIINGINCASCPMNCKSTLSRIRESGVSVFDQLKKDEFYDNQEFIPLITDGRRKMYCIKRGSVRLSTSDGGVIRICGPGDIIGYQGIDNSCTYTASTIGEVQVCCFDRELFFMVQEKSPEIMKEFFAFLSQEIELRDKRITALESYSVRNKVASTLLSLNSKFGSSSDFGSIITVPVDRKTLAQLSGTVVESLARTLTDFENSKFIIRMGRFIHIQDVEKLQKISVE
ncbi:MAG: Crp/Fnr family transcriptional regulator [Bdellovibrio sp.]